MDLLRCETDFEDVLRERLFRQSSTSSSGRVRASRAPLCARSSAHSFLSFVACVSCVCLSVRHCVVVHLGCITYRRERKHVSPLSLPNAQGRPTISCSQRRTRLRLFECVDIRETCRVRTVLSRIPLACVIHGLKKRGRERKHSHVCYSGERFTRTATCHRPPPSSLRPSSSGRSRRGPRR